MKREFSKTVLAAVMITYFIGVLVGLVVVLQDGNQLAAYLGFIGSATAVAIGFYAWKARAENILKIGKPKNKNIDVNKLIGGEEE